MKFSTLSFLSLMIALMFAACTGMVEDVPTPNEVTVTEQGASTRAQTMNPVRPSTGGSGVSQAQPQAARCNIRGTVTDMRGQDDCEFIISLEDGTRIAPVEIDRDFFNLEDGQRVILAYRQSNRRISCNRGIPAIVTCIQEIR